MATIETTSKQCYTGGILENTSQIVGYADSKNRVVRFTFNTDSVGANSVSWVLSKNYFAAGTAPGLRWYIGTDPSSHTNAGATTVEYHGDVTVEAISGTIAFSGSADIVLMPNTTYYLWIFPSVAKYGYYNLTELVQAKVTMSGGAGLVYIDNGGKKEAHQAFIRKGSGWDLCLPHRYNGSSFDLCTGEG